jgi:RHS repeat-associated protein
MPRLTGTQTRTFNYGANGQLLSKIEPETGTTTVSYNTDGTVDYKLDAKGQKVQMTYDASKRVSVIKKYPDGVNEDACQRVEMFYDGNYPADGDAGVTLNANGRLSAVRYKGASCTLLNGHTYVEQYSYLNYGAMTKKRLKVIRNVSGGGTASGVLETIAEYDGEGRLLATTYPVTGKRYQYGFDSRGLPSSLTNTTDSTTIVSSVGYGLAGEMTSFVHGGGSEGRSYNVNGQLKQITMPGRTIDYTFSTTNNNGKVLSITDSGETITYQYDALQRLTSATGTGWSQGYQYDGFGNLYNKTATGGAPTWSASIDPATNRISTTTYDANGNQTFIATTTGLPDSFNLSYDVSNRLTLAVNTGSIRSDYGYDAGNKRIWEKRTIASGASGEWFYFFGITGQRLARYNFTVAGAVITFTQDNASVWFGGKLVQKINTFGSSFANEDRLGSVGKYLPYGEDKPGATNPIGDNEKFATYTRDAGNGLDYADQRWHAQGTGRFLTSDPYIGSSDAEDPVSWNRFSYAKDDAQNYTDRTGLLPEFISDPYDGNWFDSGAHWDATFGTSRGGGLGCIKPGFGLTPVSIPGSPIGYCLAQMQPRISTPTRRPTFVRLTGNFLDDCYSTIGSQITNAQRHLSYMLVDQEGEEMDNVQWREELVPLEGGQSCPSGTTLQGGICVGRWITGQFVDGLSVGIDGRSLRWLQYFVANVGGVIYRVFADGPWGLGQGVNVLDIQRTEIRVNGSRGPTDSSGNLLRCRR